MNDLFKFLLNWSRSFLCWPVIHLSTSGFEIWYFFSIKPFEATKIHLRFTLTDNHLTSVFIQCSVIVKKRFRLKVKMVKLAITTKNTGKLKEAFLIFCGNYKEKTDLSRAVLDPPATVVIPFSEETLRASSLKKRKSVVLRPSKAEAVLPFFSIRVLRVFDISHFSLFKGLIYAL